MRFKSTGTFSSSYNRKDFFKYRYIKVKIFLCDGKIAKTPSFKTRETFATVANAVRCDNYFFRMDFEGKNDEVMKITGN